MARLVKPESVCEEVDVSRETLTSSRGRIPGPTDKLEPGRRRSFPVSEVASSFPVI